MERNATSPLLLERSACFFTKQLHKNRLPFFASLLFGFLAYAFAFTNKLVNHDEVNSLFLKGATVSSGRWGLGLLDSVFPNISMPWIYGIFSIVFIAIAVCVILRIFTLENKLLQVLLSGCVMVFPSLIGTFGYMFTASSFALSFLLAVLAVWCLKWNPKWGLVPALGCMVFSLSIYQSYIAVAASLLVLILIQRLLRGEASMPILQTGVFYVVFLAAALGIYYGATQFFLWMLDMGLNGYASGNVSFSIASLPANVLVAYDSFFRFFREGFRGLIPTDLSRTAHLLCLAATGFLLVLWGLVQKNKENLQYLLLAALLALLPLAINCMYLFTTADAVHTLVLYGFVSVYVLVAVVADACLSLLCAIPWQRCLQKAMLNLGTIALAHIVLSNVYTANAAYLNLHLRYENAYSFYTSLIADIKMMPEFTPDTKLAILGTYQEPPFYEERFSSLTHLTGVKGFLPDSYSRAQFLEYYLDFPMSPASEAEIAAIAATEEYAAMACYPYYGCMQMFNDVLVVKLSES